MATESDWRDDDGHRVSGGRRSGEGGREFSGGGGGCGRSGSVSWNEKKNHENQILGSTRCKKKKN